MGRNGGHQWAGFVAASGQKRMSLDSLAANGIAHEQPETYSNGVRHVVVLDPDGNSLSLAEAPAQ
jgi:hypothetical protein